MTGSHQRRFSFSWRARLAAPLAGVLAVLCAGPAAVQAKPAAAQIFCDIYNNAPGCAGGGQVTCDTCHTIPPTNNLYGTQLRENLAPDVAFEQALPAALSAVAMMDADEDTFSNIEEILAGTDMSDAGSKPAVDLTICEQIERETASPMFKPGYDVCAYDEMYAFKRVHVDFCGITPTYDEVKAFEAREDKVAALGETLDACLVSENWIKRDGVVWNMANAKINPLQAIKSGRDEGPIPLGDYDDDYNFFVYTNTGDRDAREMLTGDYFVTRRDKSDKREATVYRQYQETREGEFLTRGFESAQLVVRDKRAGMITSRWFLTINTMFTAMPRTTAAQAYRAFLGYDISRMEGLFPVTNEPQDFDAKGVKQADCAVCHSTLDPLTYPFSRYQGIGGGRSRLVADRDNYTPFSYIPDRQKAFVGTDGARMADTPEAGVLMGQPVANVNEWASVAANSEAFAKALVKDYWEVILGEEPRPTEAGAYDKLWKDFMGKHNYRVEAMLHDLILMEAFGVP